VADGGWTPQKVAVFKEAFEEFLNNCYIYSKDSVDPVCLGENLYLGQRMLLDAIYDGLSKDIHDFYILKARQLGISTISRALVVFWQGLHEGLSGATVFDKDENKNNARKEIEDILSLLPAKLSFPGIDSNNRYELRLKNRSSLKFMTAGIRTSKSSGTLARSTGLALAHSSELCSWENQEGIISFRESLSELHPNRLYLWESTARGFNQWWEMWQEAKEDATHKKCIFIGWWGKPSQAIERSDPDFERYGVNPPSDKEIKKIKAVKALYGVSITPEQLAWIRRKMDPNAKAEGDAPAEFSGSVIKIQEQPWTEEEAFQQSGATFFDPAGLTEICNATVSKKFKTYSYVVGLEFRDMRILPAHNARSVELKVWEEPQVSGVYVIAADVAFGANERNDRSAIQVLRCYADAVDQVAEYAWPLVTSQQFGWVIASLLGWYGSEDASECYLILEINGPGEATWTALQSLKRELAAPYMPKDVAEKGLTRIFQNVRNYIYTRSDSMSVGRNYQWKTTTQLKVAILERLRDFVTNKILTIRSLDTVLEMRSLARDGDNIEAEGTNKDDRVISLALGIRCWEERVRRSLMSQKRTKANEEAKKRQTITDQVALFNQNLFGDYLAGKAAQRRRVALAMRRRSWRG
jgi:hypothetical protein